MARKNSLPIISLLTANAISLVGNVLSAIAIPWFVLQTTGSATQTGITGFFNVLPVVLAGFFGGTLVVMLVFYAVAVRGKFKGPVGQARSEEELLRLEAEYETS